MWSFLTLNSVMLVANVLQAVAPGALLKGNSSWPVLDSLWSVNNWIIHSIYISSGQRHGFQSAIPCLKDFCALHRMIQGACNGFSNSNNL